MLKQKSKFWNRLVARIGYHAAYLALPPVTYYWLSLPVVIMGVIVTVDGYSLSGVGLYLLAGCFEAIGSSLSRHLDEYPAITHGQLAHFNDLLIIFSFHWLAIETPLMPLSQWLLLAYFFVIMPTVEANLAQHRHTVEQLNTMLLWRLVNRAELYLFMMLVPLIAVFSASGAAYALMLLVFIGGISTLQWAFLSYYYGRS